MCAEDLYIKDKQASPDMEYLTQQSFSALLNRSDFLALLEKESAVAVGVSGGPDSMALCRLLSLWSHELGKSFLVHALSVDHGLRPEAALEARQVGEWVKPWPGIVHSTLTGGAGFLQEQEESVKTSPPFSSAIMENARTLRYDVMARYCSSKNIRYLFLAHHRDDQAETLLFRLAKGSGLDGLAGMKPVQAFEDELVLLRPLLDVPKVCLIETCRHYDVPFMNDPSNISEKFARPRLRKSWAVLEAEGLTSKRLAVTARRLLRARQALEEMSEKAYEACLEEESPNRIVLNLSALKKHPEEIALRCILLAMSALRVPSRYGARLERVEDLFCDLRKTGSFRKRTLGGIVFERNDRDCFVILTAEKERAH